MRKILFVPVLFLPFLQCATLDEIPRGTCGNRVIDEATEDCDGFPLTSATVGQGSAQCAATGADACRLLCPDGDECPVGWGCGVDQICRQGTGKYAPSPEGHATAGTRLLVGDFDGDRKEDLFAGGAFTPTPSTIFYFAEDGKVANRFAINVPIMSPSVVRFSDDDQDDLVFSVFEDVAVALGQKDGTLVPVTYPRVVDKVDVLGIPLRPRSIVDDVPPNAVFAVTGLDAKGDRALGTKGRTQGLAAQGKQGADLTPLFEYDGTAGQSLADILGALPEAARMLLPGDKFPTLGVDVVSKCGEAAVAIRSARAVFVTPMCRNSLPDDALGLPPGVALSPVVWNALPPSLLPGPPKPPVIAPFKLQLPDGYAFKGGLSRSIFFVDVDNDVPGQRLDLVVSALDDKGQPATVYALSSATELGIVKRLAVPEEVLGVGDYNGDHVIDVLTPSGIFMGTSAVPTKPKDPNATDYTFKPTAQNHLKPWSMGAFVDFNGDGRSEVLAGAAGSPNIDFYSGGLAPELELSRATITTGPLVALLTGDFDGDLVPDVGIATRPDSGDAGTVDIYIAYGRRQGPPETPVRVATVKRFVHLMSLDLPGVSALVAISATSAASVDGRSTSAAVIVGTGDRFPLVTLGLDRPSCPGGARFTRTMVAAAGSMVRDEETDIFAITSDVCDGSAGSARQAIAVGKTTTDPVTKAVTQPGGDMNSPAPSVPFPQVFTSVFSAANTVAADKLLQVVTAVGSDKGTIVLTRHVPRVTSKTIGTATGSAANIKQLDLATIAEAPGTIVTPKVAVMDVDGDSEPDLVVSTGLRAAGVAAQPGKLFVLYGKGGGEFDTPVEITLGRASGGPKACETPGSPYTFGAIGPDTGGNPRMLVATTANCVYIARVFPPRKGGPAQLTALDLSHLVQVTDLTAADFTGDGVEDIALIDHGFVRLFTAEAKRK